MPFVRIWVHLIWSTKNREKIVTQSLKPKLLQHILHNANQKKIYIDQINCVEDHCHVLLSLGVSQSISKVAFLLKGESSHWVNENKLVQHYFDWQDEYIAVSVSESVVERVRNYIKNQEEHHRRKTFKEEYDLFMKKYGFKYLGGSPSEGGIPVTTRGSTWQGKKNWELLENSVLRKNTSIGEEVALCECVDGIVVINRPENFHCHDL